MKTYIEDQEPQEVQLNLARNRISFTWEVYVGFMASYIASNSRSSGKDLTKRCMIAVATFRSVFSRAIVIPLLLDLVGEILST